MRTAHFNLKKNVSLASKTTFGVGGLAELFCRARSPEEIIKVSLSAKENNIPFNIIAGGSNVILPDKALRGLTIQILGGNIAACKNGFISDAGVCLSDAVLYATTRGFSGLETLAGIPGTIGGAVYGNAGAYGRCIGEYVSEAEVFDGEKRFWIKRTSQTFGYRNSIFKFKPWIILRVKLALEKGDKKALLKKLQEVQNLRKKKYPKSLKCSGSFFKNVSVRSISRKSLLSIDRAKIIEGKIPAGYLLEAVNACGLTIGGAYVADWHGNFILNSGNATQKDVLRLANILKKRVKKRFDILLEEEVRIFRS